MVSELRHIGTSALLVASVEDEHFRLRFAFSTKLCRRTDDVAKDLVIDRFGFETKSNKRELLANTVMFLTDRATISSKNYTSIRLHSCNVGKK